MRRMAMVLLGLVACMAVEATDFQAGLAAYHRGDYETALAE